MLRWFIGVALLALTAWTALAGGHTKDSLTTVKDKVKDKTAVLVDVREQLEWDRGHLKDAKLLPLSKLRGGELKADALKALVGEAKVVYLHCASGKRCLAAAELLKKQGVDARPLKEGYADLLKAGFPGVKK